MVSNTGEVEVLFAYSQTSSMIEAELPVVWIVVPVEAVATTVVGAPVAELESSTFVKVAIVYPYPNTCIAIIDWSASATVMSAVPLKETPLIVGAVSSEVAVEALPAIVAVIVPAVKFPDASRATIAEGVFALVAVVALLATFPAVTILPDKRLAI
jgi:hypothetical protein